MKKQLGKILLVALSIALVAVTFAACKSDAKFDVEHDIAVVTREIGSGTRDGVVEALYGASNDANHKLITDNQGASIIQNTQAVLQTVAENPYAISYDSFGYCDSSVKVLEYEGVKPTQETVKNKTYAITRPFVIVSKKDVPLTELSGNAKEFYTFLQSSEAAAVINGGYVFQGPAAPAAYGTKTLSGTLKIGGSTSVGPVMDKLAQKFKDLTGVTVTVAGGGSGAGRKVGDGSDTNGWDFGMASAAISSSHNIADGLYFDIAIDGIAFIVNPKNPVEKLSKAQAGDIFKGRRDAEGNYTAPYKWNDFIA
ncbi:hypothetical protein FACS1894211_12970 [Clostridia bacterium]|nr:hypothetical protein FACS1894211_12970 [Clostridia bacterium]